MASPFHPFRRLFTSAPRVMAQRQTRPVRPALVTLEDRLAPATFTVDSISDVPVTGKETLREAITKANSNGEDDTISISDTLAGQTLTLTGGQFSVTESGKSIDIGFSGASAFTIDANKASRIFNVGAGAKLTLGRLVLVNGKADKGGNILVNGEAILNGTTVMGGEASTGAGGGICLDDTGSLTVNSSFITDNTSADNGGGIANLNSKSQLKINGSNISSNTTSGLGGGIYCGNIILVNSTIANNGANGDGGGIWFDGQLLSVNNTIVDNSADFDGDGKGTGGGLFLGGTGPDGRLTNTILAGNDRGKPGSVVSDDVVGTLNATESKFNLLGNAGSSGGLTNGTLGNLVGVAGNGIRALNTIVKNKAATNGANSPPTFALIAGSPAIDVGDKTLAVNPGSFALSTDQRGFPFNRVVGKEVDIGAFEYQNIAPEIVTPTAKIVILEDDANGIVFTGAGKTFTVTDDSNNAPSYTVGLKSEKNTLTLGSTNGITDLTGNGTDSITFKAPTVAAINAVLDGLKYVAAANLNKFSTNTSPTISVTVDDGDANAPGGAKNTSNQFTPEITPVIDTPSVTSPTTDKDVAVAVTFSRNVADGNEISHFRVKNIVGGTLTYSGPLGGTTTVTPDTPFLMQGSFAALIPDADTKLTFTPTAGFVGKASFDIEAGMGQYADVQPNVVVFGGTVVTATINVAAAGTPTAQTTPPAIGDTYANTTKYEFDVVYKATAAGKQIDASTISDKNVQVTGPSGYSETAVFVSSVPFPGNADQITVTYRIPAPGGKWDKSDNGDYRITLADNQVKDTAGTAVPGGVLATVAANLTNTATGGSTGPVVTGYSAFGVGADAGGGGKVTFRTGSFGAQTELYSVTPFSGFTGAVRTASGDFNDDGFADLVVATGPGSASAVKILDGQDQNKVLFEVAPFEASFTGGVFVAVGDLNGDGTADLVITPDEGGGPRCRLFSGKTFTQIADFFGIDDPNFRGGARAALSDLNGDGRADLLVAAGFGGGPRLALYDAAKLTTNGGPKITGDFFVFEQSLRNGVFIAAGDINGDGYSDVVVGGGPGGGPRVFALSGKDLSNNGTQTQLANFFAGDVNSRGGVRIAMKNLDSDNNSDIVVGAGTGSGSKVIGYLGKNVQPDGTPAETFNFDAFPGFSGGVFVG
ncbi:MAG: FG-GAP-like repeat-containing protein [Gemmataceae bacterium]